MANEPITRTINVNDGSAMRVVGKNQAEAAVPARPDAAKAPAAKPAAVPAKKEGDA